MHVATAETEFAEARRSRAESAEFEFTDSPAGVICTNRGNDKVYVVATTTCTCPDWTYRGSKTGQPCKHSVALRLHFIKTGGVL